MNKQIIEAELKRLDEDQLRLLRTMLKSGDDYSAGADNHIDQQALLNLIKNDFIEWVDDWRDHVRLKAKAHSANKLTYECPLCVKTHNGGIWGQDLSLCEECLRESRESDEAELDEARKMRERAEHDFIVSMKRH
jgi:hypothetical protein